MVAQPIRAVVDALHAAGLTLALTSEFALKVTPVCVLTPELRDLIRTSKDMLVAWLRQPAANDAQTIQDAKVAPKVELKGTAAQAAQPPAVDSEVTEQYARANEADMAMSRAEADTFKTRQARFLACGQVLEDVDRLAEKLLIRDREGDDRRLCLECTYYESAGRCVAAATGRLPGVSARLEPVPTVLQRCEAFGLRKGLV